MEEQFPLPFQMIQTIESLGITTSSCIHPDFPNLAIIFAGYQGVNRMFLVPARELAEGESGQLHREFHEIKSAWQGCLEMALDTESLIRILGVQK